MKQKNMMKKFSALVLASAMLLSGIPQFARSVYAQDIKSSELPTEQFATVEQLKNFSTSGQGDYAKVYFGNDSHEWWLAGSQKEDSVTVMAATPITHHFFNDSFNNIIQYNDEWKCDYASTGNENPSEVNVNHYGASQARKKLKELEKEYFTPSEQKFMKDTTIYTVDYHNKVVYSTTDILYLPSSDSQLPVIKVGMNGSDVTTINQEGIPVMPAFFTKNGEYGNWMRSPYYEIGNIMLVGSEVHRRESDDSYSLTPAFELSLSSVLFASSVPAVTKEGSLDIKTVNDINSKGAFTLRYKADNLGSAEISNDKNKITLKNVPNSTYLVVQNNDAAYAKQINGEASISAKEDFKLYSFENCKIWLERTEDRITYATMGIEIDENAVASVNGKQYTSLELALNNANDGDTVVLLKDIEFNDRLSISKNINLDLNGKTININSGNLNINSNIEFNIVNEDDGDIKNGVNVGYGIINQGILTTEGSISCDIYNQTSSSKIENGTYSGTISNEGVINNGIYLGTVTLDDSGVIKDGIFDKNSIVDGYGTIDDGEYRGYNSFFGPVNGGDFYSPVTLWGSEYNSFCKGVVNGGNFAQEPILEYGAKYGEGLVLAKTNNGELPYKIVKKDDAITLNITLGNNLTLESGKLQQAVENDVEIQPITIKVNEGYYLSEDYINNLQNQLDGLTVTETDTGFTISGVLTSNVNIALPAPTLKVYGMTLSGNGTFTAVCVEYEPITAKEITITNTGNIDLENVNVSVTGKDADKFELNWDNTTTIQPNGTIKVSVKPANDLAVSTYQAILSVSADNVNTVTTDLQFTVSEHDYNAVVIPPTCTEKGYTTYTCKNCPHSYIGDEVTPNGHNWGEWETISSPTCEQDGLKKRTCIDCGFYETENLVSAGHEWEDDYTVDKEPTCTEDGSKSIHCKNCDAVKDSTTITNLGHSFTNYVSDNNATCTKDGTKTAKCDRCDETDTIVDVGTMLKHEYEWVFNNDATCEKNGTETGTCKHCQTTVTREKVDTALEHEFKNYVSDENATCTENGTETAKCERCNKTDTRVQENSALGHKLGEWEVVKEPTTAETGMKERHCERCDYKETEIIPMITDEKPATPTNPDKPNPDKSNTDKPNTNEPNDDKGSAETGDSANVGLFTSVFAISALGITILSILKKKRALDRK